MHLAAGQDHLTCDFCKTIYFPEAESDDQGVHVLDEVPDRACPVCAVALWEASLSAVPLLYCKRCRGMLLGMGAFESLIDLLRAGGDGDQASQPADHSELDRKINCPQCHKRMETHFYFGGGSVVIDDCDSCSLIWLDHGELARIAHAPHHSEVDD